MNDGTLGGMNNNQFDGSGGFQQVIVRDFVKPYKIFPHFHRIVIFVNHNDEFLHDGSNMSWIIHLVKKTICVVTIGDQIVNDKVLKNLR